MSQGLAGKREPMRLGVLARGPKGAPRGHQEKCPDLDEAGGALTQAEEHPSDSVKSQKMNDGGRKGPPQQSRPSALRAVAGKHSDRKSKEDEDATGEPNYYGFAPHTQPAAKSEQPNYACDILNTRLPTLCKRYARDSFTVRWALRSARRARSGRRYAASGWAVAGARWHRRDESLPDMFFDHYSYWPHWRPNRTRQQGGDSGQHRHKQQQIFVGHVTTWPSWHREASKSPVSSRGCQSRGVDGYLLIATAVPRHLGKPGQRKLVRYLAMASGATDKADSSLVADCRRAICLEVMQLSTRRWAAMPPSPSIGPERAGLAGRPRQGAIAPRIGQGNRTANRGIR